MKINDVEIDDTYAEGFSMYASRVLITAENLKLAKTAASVATGYATSTIHCDSEAGIDNPSISADDTPDGRPGVSVIFCVNKKDKMDNVLLNRIGQCILTSATTSCFDWFPEDIVSEKTFEVKTGFKLKFFGDGFEEKDEIQWKGKVIPVWKIPVMDGHFFVQNSFKVTKIAGGGNFMVFGKELHNTIESCNSAVEKMNEVDGIVLPFPGGYVRSPSKVGSKYKFLNASTNESLSPVLIVKNTIVPDGSKAGYEFIINGFDENRVKEAIKRGILELTKQPGIMKITAGNYGGKLGKIFFHLKEILGK